MERHERSSAIEGPVPAPSPASADVHAGREARKMEGTGGMQRWRDGETEGRRDGETV